ncbi:MAG: DUF1552 domain-containing protein [Bdellovibrionaceae bacterium]|nr:DUF1552 domain-containing protein [Pseudobdellovibrionaceae bacterium]MBX3034046.1 DUF1552 domain-containing protein [Pseudobdellovibrionaceae bacterium]
MSFKPLSRRAFLQAGGAFIALPVLEAMLPFGKTAFAAGNTPLRYASLFFPHACPQASDWYPTIVSGKLVMNASGMVNPMTPYINDISFIRNLFPDSWAVHPGGVATFATGGSAKEANKVLTRRTADQLIADLLQGDGRIHSIAMGSDEQSGGEAGVSGVYGTNISWLGTEQPNTRYMSNSQIFNLIVPGGGSTTQPTSNTRQSILDFAKDSIARTQAKLGTEDKKIFDSYLTNLREVEKKIQATNPPPSGGGGNTTLNPAMASCSTVTSAGSCSDYPTDMDIKMDLIALAFQADRTRVITHMFDPEPGYRNMSFISGVKGNNHDISHWKTDPTKLLPMMQKVCNFYVGKYARLLSRLKSMPEVGGTVLDNSYVTLGSSYIDCSDHVAIDIPMIAAGRMGGAITPGTLKTLPARTNISSFYYTIAKKMGVTISSYAGFSSMLDIG